MNEFQSLKQEVLSLKRNLSEVTSSQNELVHMVKSLKKSNDAKNFDEQMLPYCMYHTLNAH